jgi:glutamine synthetase
LEIQADGHVDPEQLEDLFSSGRVDTVICALTDLWGRLMGKRVTARTCRGLLNGERLHASYYLFTVDMDMDPQPGFALTDWERGFQDFEMVPDWSTLRLVPWLDRTALVLCDAVQENSDEPVGISPRQILKRQIERAKTQGLKIFCGSEVEVFFFRDSYRDAWQQVYRDLHPMSYYRTDYHLLQTTKDEWLISQIRNGMEGARVPIESSKGEWGLGQHEINLVYADALEMADRHAIYKHGIKEIAALDGLSATFMAKWSAREVGSSCHIHSSLWDAEGQAPLSVDAANPEHASETFTHYLGGLLSTARELSWMFAPYPNSYRRYVPDSFAPTTITWGRDNRTCAFRVIGHGASFRVENRTPGADANPYLAFAATIAGGLKGIEGKLDPGEEYAGNAYTADRPRLPASMEESIAGFEASAVAKDALGDEVFTHLLQVARHEQQAFERYLYESEIDPHAGVTDWELRRYFERG